MTPFPATPKRNQRRTNARLAAVQALYQLETTGLGVETVILEFQTHRLGGDIEGYALHNADSAYFAELTRGAVEAQKRVDPFIQKHLAKNWRLSRLDATVRAILRAGIYELTSLPDTPTGVIIDEYVEIAHAFFDGDEPAFINGLLDAAAKAARIDETRNDAV